MIMQTLLGVQQQNTEFQKNLTQIVDKINSHSSTLDRHGDEISRLSTAHSDLQHAFSDRTPIPEIIISSIPKGLQLSADDFTQRFFTFLGLEAKFKEVYFRSARYANAKRLNANTDSLIIRMISGELCDEILTIATQKRRTVKFTIKSITGIDNEGIVYVNKMQSTYIQHLAYLSRQAKKRFGWRSVWTHASNVCIQKADQSPTITISTLSQLEDLTK